MPQATRPAPADPAKDRLLALADRCVQCGLCLPHCPTHRHDQLEAESPRGRIALARAWALATLEPTPVGDRHLEHCLGCRSCEAVCPAGVQYGELLVEVRSRQRERRATGWKQRTIEGLAARPRQLDRLLRLYRRVHRWLPRALRPLPRPPSATASTSPVNGAKDTVGLFLGCVARPYEAGLRDAVVRLCGAADVRVIEPDAQTCCGSLHAHAGHLAARDRLATANRAAFIGCTTVLTLASGCHSAVADGLAGTASTRDAIAYLHEHAAKLRFRESNECVALHLPCTQRSVVKSVAALRALLGRVPGLQIIELTAGYGCCGAAGTQMLTDPARANDYRAPLLEQFARSGATRLLNANIGCRLHFANAVVTPVQHPLEFLAALALPAALDLSGQA